MPDVAGQLPDGSGWRKASPSVSLPEVHGSIAVPEGAGFWRKLLAFAGPGYRVAVGYMDPGNWATDLAGGARYGYTLLSVVMLSNLMAILLQALALRLGIASGRDLAQACRDHYSKGWPMIFSGAGVRGGQVIGATDADGVDVTDRPIGVADLCLTLCHIMGMKPDDEYRTTDNRPIKLVEGGKLIHELFA